MFEIGNSLREARIRRGIDFPRAELSTKIRGKYLRALEDENFEVLPAQTYIKGFLRTYADYLGLDGQLYVDEYNSRFVAGDEHELRPRRSTARPQRRNRRVETNVVLIALGAIALVTIVVISAWKFADQGSSPSGKAPAAKVVQHAKSSAVPLLVVKPLRDSTHVTARTGSATGNVAFDGTLQQGDQALALRGVRLWVQISSPENLQIKVQGRIVHVPGLKPAVIIVTHAGWRPASS